MKKAQAKPAPAANGLYEVYAKLRKAYQVACPIATLNTPDPAQSVRSIIEALPQCHVITWDCARGGRVPEQPEKREAEQAAAAVDLKALNLVDFLISCENLPGFKGADTKGSVVVVLNAHRFLSESDVMQQVWNLRDAFKNPKRLLVLMGTNVRVPAELQHDVIELDEPLPDASTLRAAIEKVGKDAGLEMPADVLDDAAAAAQGMSTFGCEQLAALNMSKAAGGVSVRGVWKDKCSKINETPGLKVITGGSFADIAGVEQIKKFLAGILNGREKPRTVVFMDEIEKAFGGAAGDTSGVSQDQLGVLLQYMQDRRAAGVISVGPPGTCKSALAKAAGSEAGIPTIQFDLGGMKDSLVGGSEARIREALKVIDAVSGGQTLWLATCNSLTTLPPELRRRFKYGTWFFDLPDLEERREVWKLYCSKYELPEVSEGVLQQQLTGAEIESACEIAWKINCSVEEATSYIVPISRAGAQQVEGLRAGAEGRLLSASKPGVYQRGSEAQGAVSGTSRFIED